MGYYMESTETSFLLKKEKEKEALKSLLALQDDKCCWNKTNLTIEKVMEEFGWVISKNENGDYDSIYFPEGHRANEDGELDAIAPYVKNGSYILMLGEDGTQWRFIFEDGKCIEKNTFE